MPREHWSHQFDYFVSLLGYGVGSGTFIKFPFYCMRNGGGAFLILFLFFTIIGAIPCVFLEMTIGQYSQSGPINVWNLCPSFKGLGVGALICVWFFISYYNAIFSWFMYYLFYSFSEILPWDNCNNTWNTPTCISSKDLRTFTNVTIPSYNASETGITANITGVTAAEEFWKNKMLEMTDGLDNLGGVRWQLVGCLAITHVILFLWIFKGIRVSGKLVYITVGLPYILITVFLIRGCLLPGSADGIYYYIYPKFERLTEPKIWIQSCSFALHSLGIASGCITSMSGHNRMDNNCFKNAVLLCLADSLSAILTGFAFFTIVGHVAYIRGVNVDAFESSGYNLAFIVYPEMLASLPFPQSWSVLTFATLMMLGIDSMVPGIATITAALEDVFSQLFKKRLFFTCAVLLSTFLFALLYVSQGGIYVVTLVDWFAYFPSTALIAMLECMVVGWFYGTERLQVNISKMWGKKMPREMVISLKFVCPLLLLVTFCYSLYSYRPPKYGDYIYPAWATGVGWMISLSSILPIPIIWLWTVLNRNETSLKEKIKRSMEPNENWTGSTGMEGVLQPMAGHELTSV
ncbi:sodium-dependent noradrenaline transporter-like [Haliotis cracherodii]|uniref:sodium-dependent noradrenaline transporter-like n=1 Tax=Haliotis cracherodii TaxID=6455 RepID=UPI0039ECB3D3